MVDLGTRPEDTERVLKQLGINLTVSEAYRLRQLLGRDPSLTELHIFDTMWSEHCSYKSSRKVLKKYLPMTGSRVIIGPGEDAGVVRLASFDGKDYVLVVAHESHNHPSQILPVEGAATGIGGIVRDVYCMGADVVGVMDALRFGDPQGEKAEIVKEIIEGVVTGIWQYGNALGVPNVGGDVYFDADYDENCLVNVIALGIAEEGSIIRSRVPEEARHQPYDIIIVGKPTDLSGLGGATLASRILDAERTESIGAVQLHDPFLKRVLVEATHKLLAEARASGFRIGFKDLGAGGISCAVSEMVGSAGFGAEIDLDSVHVALDGMEAFAIACSETQERYCLAVPESFSGEVLKIYNELFELPHIYRGAKASVIGRVKADGTLIVRHGGEVVVDVPVDLIIKAIEYDRPAKPRLRPQPERVSLEGIDIKDAGLRVLASISAASKHYIYRHYDCEVKGRAVLRPGEADACVIAIADTPFGIATSVDGNPRVSKIDPYLGGVWAVVESVSNVACLGGVPVAITDCLNFGNPEDPFVMHDFNETVRGIGDAARALKPFGSDEPLPVVSGNVSFYNESASGKAIPPSPIVACYGLLDDYSVAASLTFKREGSQIVLIGKGGGGLGGSALLASLGKGQSDHLPELDLEERCRVIHAVTEIVRRGEVLACHDISDGGLFVTLAEMCIGGWGLGRLGARVRLEAHGHEAILRLLFAEDGGFVLECGSEFLPEIERICKRYRTQFIPLGTTISDPVLEISWNGGRVEFEIANLKESWLGSLEETVT